MGSKNENNNNEMVWYLDKPEVKEVSTTNKFQILPKLRYNPFVYTFGIAFAGVVSSFSYGVYCTMIDKNDQLKLRIYRMMQLRVGFQAVAVASIMGGMWYFNRQVEHLQEQRID